MTVSAAPDTAYYLKSLQDQHEWTQLVAALDRVSTDTCVSCGLNLGGFLGTFAWGIQNGVGFCSHCDFPYLYYHRFTERGKELLLMAFVPLAEIPLQE